MVETLRVFLAEEALATLEDKYVEEDQNALHRFVFGLVRDMARSAKMVLLSGELKIVVFDQDGKVKNETIPLKGLKIPDPVSNKEWLPEFKGEKLVPFELKIGDKTLALLQAAYGHYMIRAERYNAAIPESDKNKKQKSIIPATCFEEFIHGGLIMPVMAEVENSINQELDKEFDIVYPAPKPKEPIAKKR